MANRNFSERMKPQRTEAKKVGIEKFRRYAEPRGIFLNEASYGLYKVVSHSGKTSQREAVRAAVKDEETSETILGWVINLANRQRKFVADGEGWKLYPLGKKHLPKEGLFTGTAVPVQVDAIPTIQVKNGKVIASGIALGVEI